MVGRPEPAAVLLDAARSGVFDGLQAGCLVASGVALAGAVIAALALPSRPAVQPEGDATPAQPAAA